MLCVAHSELAEAYVCSRKATLPSLRCWLVKVGRLAVSTLQSARSLAKGVFAGFPCHANAQMMATELTHGREFAFAARNQMCVCMKVCGWLPTSLFFVVCFSPDVLIYKPTLSSHAGLSSLREPPKWKKVTADHGMEQEHAQC